jgi:protease-4
MAMSKTAKFLLIGGGGLFIVALIAVVAIVFFVGAAGNARVPQNSVLVLRLAGGLPDYVPDDPTARIFGLVPPQSYSDVLTQLRKAKVDKRIGGVLLELNFPDMGWGKAEELREAIKDFKKSGKPVYAYMDIGMNKEYYIATVADKVYMPPAGDLYINGFAAQAMFFKGSLDKLGVEVEVIQRNPKYKTAPDQYTKKEMGEGQREVTNALLDEYFSRLTNAIAESRSKSPEDVAKLMDDAPYHADEAKKLGLIDDAVYRDQVYELFKAQLGYKAEDKLRTVGGLDYREIPASSVGLNKGERVAVIYASGAINMGRSSNGAFGGEMIGADTVVESFNAAADDPSIKAIVLRVDSPGGSALASDLMWRSIENAKAKKPVVVSMGDVAASGGYYIACNANKIVAQPTTITGSIGVFQGKPVLKGLYDWMGISTEYTLRGKNSGIFRETEKWTESERAKMESQADKIYYDDFLPKVSKGRGKSVEEINNIAQGRVWTGVQAKDNGLVDEFGGLEKAIEIAKQLANLPAEKEVERVNFPEGRPFLEEFLGSSNASVEENAEEMKLKKAFAASLPADVRRVFRYAELFDRMSKGEAMLLLPFEIEVK